MWQNLISLAAALLLYLPLIQNITVKGFLPTEIRHESGNLHSSRIKSLRQPLLTRTGETKALSATNPRDGEGMQSLQVNPREEKKENPPSKHPTATSSLTKHDKPTHQAALTQPAGPLWAQNPGGDQDMSPKLTTNRNKRVLVLCTGGTLTMAKDPDQDNALAPVPGALTNYIEGMEELKNPDMPEVVAYEYSPLIDSSDMGPGDWAVLANDIGENYYHFDGFVVLTGTDTMAYAASALSFMLENLGKPVVFTGR